MNQTESKTNAIAGKYMFHKYLKETFKGDKDVTVGEFDEDTDTIVITVAELWKATYLNMMIGGVNNMWDANIFVHVVTGNSFRVDEPAASPVETVFRGNENFIKVIEVEGALMTKIHVAVFKPVLVQIQCDNAFNEYGFETYVFEDVVKNAFSKPISGGVVFTSDKMQ